MIPLKVDITDCEEPNILSQLGKFWAVL